MKKRPISQAVILIHGMGEQLPMDTLREFVNAVLPMHEDGIKFFSQPDTMTDTYELRILQNRKWPRTHFIEYYWAYKVEGTTFSHVTNWLKTLLWRKYKDVTRQMLPFWLISWLLIAAVAIGLAVGVIEADFFKLSGISALIFSVIQGYILNSIGDAARYFNPTPRNIRIRQSIRKDGIDLIKKLHASEEYDRIILVGHSLGSVIGYDILKYLWQEYNQIYKNPRKEWHEKFVGQDIKPTKEALQPKLQKVEELGERLRGEDLKDVDEYIKAQRNLWLELRGMGNPWLVTDFITLGSPLAHAPMFLARSIGDLLERQGQKEFPVNPPYPEEDDEGVFYSYKWYSYPYGDEMEFSFRPWVIHHAGLFACTTWTNLYFPVKFGIFGDIVGGPLQPWFGPGIKDVPMRTTRFIRDRTLKAHTSYWHNSKNKAENKNAFDLLLKALDLDNSELIRKSQQEDK